MATSIRWTLLRSSAPIASSRIRRVSAPSTLSASATASQPTGDRVCSAAITTTEAIRVRRYEMISQRRIRIFSAYSSLSRRRSVK
jgi:hypothetical protein